MQFAIILSGTGISWFSGVEWLVPGEPGKVVEQVDFLISEFNRDRAIV